MVEKNQKFQVSFSLQQVNNADRGRAYDFGKGKPIAVFVITREAFGLLRSTARPISLKGKLMLNSSNSAILLILIASLLSGCAATSAGKAPSTDLTKVQTKIGFAIGRETASFKITNQHDSEAPGGYNRTDYTVITNEGTKYNCYILEPSKFGKFMTWGMGTGADAVCSAISSGAPSGTATHTNSSCNSLLHAAGKC